MWVQFKVYWQDGLYMYNPGKVVELPTSLAIGYIQSGKAKKCNPPKWALQAAKEKGKPVPSARRRIKRISTKPQDQLSVSEMADQMFDED